MGECLYPRCGSGVCWLLRHWDSLTDRGGQLFHSSILPSNISSLLSCHLDRDLFRYRVRQLLHDRRCGF